DTSGFVSVQPATTAFHTDAHRKYLSDPTTFARIPDNGMAKGATAVVGSKECLFYPGAKIRSADDLSRLPEGVPVPFATILPITGDKVSDPNGDHNGMFSFQDNWNWFYPTRFKGRTGLVFGADLYGLNDSNEDNRITALLYQSDGHFDSFYPVLGYRPLSAAILARLKKDRLALQSVDPAEYNLYEGAPDDMISLYLTHRPSDYSTSWNRKSPVFVTTDLAAHAEHLMFDRQLQYLEESFFTPRLKTLTSAFVDKLKAREAQASSYSETLAKAELYFQVARALLDLAPTRQEGTDANGAPTVTYAEKDKETVLAAYPPEVRAEIALMDAGAGFQESAVFTFAGGAVMKEDYSQYKPRGHYTKNGVLSAYFRAMMWFGRIHFLIAQEGATPAATASGQSSDSTDLTLVMEPIAMLVTDLVKGDEGLYRSWAALFDPITDLIGLSDDLSFEDVLPLWKDQSVSDFGAWAGDKEKLLKFMALAHEKLRPPAISGSSVFEGPSEGPQHKPPMGWRLFGQRFTLDSAIHEQVSPPRLMSRDMVRGLDIMKVFGSRTADALLQQSDYPKMEGLRDRLNGLQKAFDAYPWDYWQKTYYNSVLFEVKSQALFEPGAGFYFTESPAWGTKAMLSAHGTWAELRHDTILYVKQVYAERSGDGDYEPTFRTLPIPDPIHYVEPNVPFWQGSVLAVQNLLKVLDSYKMLDEESAAALGRLQKLLARAADIAATEAEDKPVAPEDVAWIATIPAELAQVVLLHTGNGGSMDPDQLKMALIADVYTNVSMGQVLETGVGIPYRLYVALDDGQGGKRIAVGYTFSYYEFGHPMEDRMTDEQWKELVYKGPNGVADDQPFWSKGSTLDPEPAR
ncbi:MAG TPA: DUF3160 domain-containing protein, partial [Spirochaetia bacterium]|nr:DUF3160 domain-containing protein [Spirochaetia bacterium]